MVKYKYIQTGRWPSIEEFERVIPASVFNNLDLLAEIVTAYRFFADSTTPETIANNSSYPTEDVYVYIEHLVKLGIMERLDG